MYTPTHKLIIKLRVDNSATERYKDKICTCDINSDLSWLKILRSLILDNNGYCKEKINIQIKDHNVIT